MSVAPQRKLPTEHGMSIASSSRLAKATSAQVDNTVPRHREEDGADDRASPMRRSEASSTGMVLDAPGDRDGNSDMEFPELPDIGGIVDEVARIADDVSIPSHTVHGPSSSAPDTSNGQRASPAPVTIDRPITMTYLRTSSMLTEITHPSIARINPPQMPRPPFEARKHARIPFLVKQITSTFTVLHSIYLPTDHTQTDTWESLPRLGHRLASGEYTLVDPPHDDDTPKRIEALLDIGRSGFEASGGLADVNADLEPPSPSSRPCTPSSDPFFITDNVARLIENTKAKFEEIQSLHSVIQEDYTSLQDRARNLMDRHHPFLSQTQDGGRAVSEDIRDTYIALSRVHEVLSRFSSAFSVVPTVPWNWMSLVELLTKIEELRELYRISWERFDVLEEEQRPIRGEVYRLCENVAHVQACLDGIANETVHACEPLIHNLFLHFSTRLEGIERRLHLLDGGAPILVGPREPTFGEVLNQVTRLSARMDALERAVADPLKTRIEVTIGNYLAERGLTDDIIRQLGIDIGRPPEPVPVGGSISDILHTVYPGPTVGGSTMPSSAGRVGVPSGSGSTVLSSIGSSARYSIGIPGDIVPSTATTMSAAATSHGTSLTSHGPTDIASHRTVPSIGRGAGGDAAANMPAAPRCSSRQRGARHVGSSSVAGRGGNGGVS